MLFESVKAQISKKINKAAKYKDDAASVLSWNSSFADLRDKSIKEHIDFTKKNDAIDDIHLSHDLASLNITPEQSIALYRYCSMPSKDSRGFASSNNINSYLRNKAGDTHLKIVGDHKLSDVHKAVQELSSAFTPENTNRKEITTYAGIPEHIAKRLSDKGPNSHHVLAGFTSTTTTPSVALQFAKGYNRHAKEYHVMQLKLKPSTGLSVVPHSGFQEENEVLVHHGSRITYHGSEEIPAKDDKPKIIIHHVTVHDSHRPLEAYREFTQPKE